VTLQFTLTARITMIVIIALITAWAVAIALFYWSQHLEGAGPAPRQIASLVELIERTPQQYQRPLPFLAGFFRGFSRTRSNSELG